MEGVGQEESRGRVFLSDHGLAVLEMMGRRVIPELSKTGAHLARERQEIPAILFRLEIFAPPQGSEVFNGGMIQLVNVESAIS